MHFSGGESVEKETPGEEEEEEERKRVVTRRRRTGDDLYANTTNTNKKKRMRLRAFAREYPTYDELPGRPHGGKKTRDKYQRQVATNGERGGGFFLQQYSSRTTTTHTRTTK